MQTVLLSGCYVFAVCTPFMHFLPTYHGPVRGGGRLNTSVVLLNHVLQLFVGDSEAFPVHIGYVICFLGLPCGRLTFGYAQNNSAGTHLGCILISFLNNLKGPVVLALSPDTQCRKLVLAVCIQKAHD